MELDDLEMHVVNNHATLPWNEKYLYFGRECYGLDFDFNRALEQAHNLARNPNADTYHLTTFLKSHDNGAERWEAVTNVQYILLWKASGDLTYLRELWFKTQKVHLHGIVADPFVVANARAQLDYCRDRHGINQNIVMDLNSCGRPLGEDDAPIEPTADDAQQSETEEDEAMIQERLQFMANEIMAKTIEALGCRIYTPPPSPETVENLEQEELHVECKHNHCARSVCKLIMGTLIIPIVAMYFMLHKTDGLEG